MSSQRCSDITAPICWFSGLKSSKGCVSCVLCMRVSDIEQEILCFPSHILFFHSYLFMYRNYANLFFLDFSCWTNQERCAPSLRLCADTLPWSSRCHVLYVLMKSVGRRLPGSYSLLPALLPSVLTREASTQRDLILNTLAVRSTPFSPAL
jgi:hypothetical protein